MNTQYAILVITNITFILYSSFRKTAEFMHFLMRNTRLISMSLQNIVGEEVILQIL
jgi:hypothetical protein